MKVKHGVMCPLAALAVLLAVVAVMAQWDTARAAGSFNPTSTAEVHNAEHGAQCDNAVDDDNDGVVNDGCPADKLGPTGPEKKDLGYCDDALDNDNDGKVNDGCDAAGPSAPGDNGNVVRVFEIPKGDYNYKKTLDVSPTAFSLKTDLPLGTWVANLDALSTLGLMNNVCKTDTPVLFNMFTATIDMSTTVTRDDSYGDLDNNGLLDGVEKYPDFLKTYFPGVTPTLRLFGTAQVGGTPVTMNIVFFEPGTTLLDKTFDASLGSPSAQVLNNPMAMLPPNAITDICSPLIAKTTLFGISWDNPDTAADEGGKVFATNPTAAGDYTFTTWAVNRLDTDGDGLESYIDTCPYDVNEGDPLDPTSGDNDRDGINNVCDTTPEENVGYNDPDGDVYLNRGDLCPEVANADQTDTDADDIGDVCDKEPNTANGVPIERTVTATVTLAAAAAATPTTVAPAVTPTTVAPAVTPTTAPAVTPKPTTAPAVTPTTAPAVTPKPTPTAAVTPKPTTVAPTTPIVPTGGAGLLGSDGGFPVWAIYIIAVAAALMLASIGMMATVVWHRRQ